MTGRELAGVAHRKPFEPYRVVLADGRAFPIRFPGWVGVGRETSVFGTGRPDDTVPDEFVFVPNESILAAEPLG